MDTNFNKITQIMLSEITANIMMNELELEQLANNHTLEIKTKVSSMRTIIRNIANLEIELQKLTSMMNIDAK